MLRSRVNSETALAYPRCGNTPRGKFALFSRSELLVAPWKKSGRCGFTLIELLVTVTIVGVLMSLLMPALGSAKRKAESARCISNLHQLGITIRLYADENSGRLPSAEAFRPSQTNSATGLPAIQQVLVTYSRAVTNLFKCPADKAGVYGGSSYDWNSSLNGRSLSQLAQAPSQESAKGAFLLRDHEGWHSRGRRNAVFSDGRAGPAEF